MKRPQKRYESHDQIVGMIDDVHHSLKADGFQIEREEALVEECRLWIGNHPQESITNERIRTEWHEKRDTMVKAKERIEKLKRHLKTLEGKLRMLKEKLAAFDTEPMPFLGDKSVV